LKKLLYKIKAFICDFVANIRIYIGGIVLFGDSSYKIKGPHMRGILETLVPGDVLLRRYNNYLGSIIISGYWSHAAIYMCHNSVVHMLGKGIVKEDILTFMRTDDITILRCADEGLINQALTKATEYLNEDVDYDYNFTTKDDNKMYCTELILNCFFCKDLEYLFSKHIVKPDLLLDTIFKTVWTTQSIN